MDQRQRSVLSLACAVLVLAGAGGVARADNYHDEGVALFTDVQAGTQQGGLVPYVGLAESPLLGLHTESGTIRNLTGLIPVDETTFMFMGEVGPHPDLPGHPAVHVIRTDHGDIYCTWTAVFTLRIVNANGDAVLSGDGDFTVTGGTRRYRHASGAFRTLFETDPIPRGADTAVGHATEDGNIRRR